MIFSKALFQLDQYYVILRLRFIQTSNLHLNHLGLIAFNLNNFSHVLKISKMDNNSYIYSHKKDICLQIKTLLSYNDFSICTIACEEAYNKSEELDACTLGCKSQVPHVVENQSQVIYRKIIMLKITDINAYDESVERYAGIADLFIFTL